MNLVVLNVYLHIYIYTIYILNIYIYDVSTRIQVISINVDSRNSHTFDTYAYFSVERNLSLFVKFMFSPFNFINEIIKCDFAIAACFAPFCGFDFFPFGNVF